MPKKKKIIVHSSFTELLAAYFSRLFPPSGLLSTSAGNSPTWQYFGSNGNRSCCWRECVDQSESCWRCIESLWSMRCVSGGSPFCWFAFFMRDKWGWVPVIFSQMTKRKNLTLIKRIAKIAKWTTVEPRYYGHQGAKKLAVITRWSK